jgi:hypothetical protein
MLSTPDMCGGPPFGTYLQRCLAVDDKVL